MEVILSWNETIGVDAVSERSVIGDVDAWAYCSQGLTTSNDLEENEESLRVWWIVHDVARKDESEVTV